jgi:fumarylacetoacetase
MKLNATHNASLQSWVTSANDMGCDFPIQNLPHGVFKRAGTNESFRGGVAIGDQILDIQAAVALGVFAANAKAIAMDAGKPKLNDLMARSSSDRSALRAALSECLRAGSPHAAVLASCLVPQDQAEYGLAANVGDYTDFFTSYNHMVNCGMIFNPQNPEVPCFKHLPIAYHGRASSVSISGTNIKRPWGQINPPAVAGAVQAPIHAACRALDYEMELGIWISGSNALGSTIKVSEAEEHIFGMCLLNDWSARDIQGWESTPLGPFLGKNFCTSVAPWIVTWEALAPYRTSLPRAPTDPQTLPYLLPKDAKPAIDICCEVWLETPTHPAKVQISSTSYKHSYWTPAQMIAHHTSGGCNLQSGDLFGTGTISGLAGNTLLAEEGCLLELSKGGKVDVTLSSGEARRFLMDGDTLTLKGSCTSAGHVRIGFGEVLGKVLAADSRPYN